MSFEILETKRWQVSLTTPVMGHQTTLAKARQTVFHLVLPRVFPLTLRGLPMVIHRDRLIRRRRRHAR